MNSEVTSSEPSHKQEASGGIQSLDAALRVLQHLASLPGAAGVSELARACDMPVSKVHRYLASFAHAGLVQQNGRSGTYDLGLAAQSLGLAAISRRDVVNNVGDEMRQLTLDTGCTMLLSVWAEAGPTVVRWDRAPSPVVTSMGLGTTFPLLTSATGRAFYAFSSDAVVGPLAKRELDSAHLNPSLVAELKGGIKPEKLASEIRARVKADRVATVDGRFIPGLLALAVPILNWQNEAEVVVTAIGTDPSMTDPEGALSKTMLAFSKRLSL